MNKFRSWSRRAWLLHGYLIAVLAFMPAPSLRSVWLDTDSDTVKDSWEDVTNNTTHSLAALDAMSLDVDDDGAYNSEELAYGSDPFDIDSDDDGLNDGDEIHLANEQAMKGYSLLMWDSNDDGVSDHDDFYGFTGVTYPGGVLPSFSNATYSDYDGDGIKNPFDPYPADPSNNDGDGDGITDDVDPAPNDASNSSPNNGTAWHGDALGDADSDGVYNFWDTWPNDGANGSGDSDNDGIPNSSDPCPNDNSNYSVINGIHWHGDVLGDADLDYVSNYSDAWPYDANNGNGGGNSNDNDSDGIENDLDPAPQDSTNYSSINSTAWGSQALEDSDDDGSINFNDPYPNDTYDNVPDFDGDGLNNDLDPYPKDSTNHSPINNTTWGTDVLGDEDSDGVLNWMDAYLNDVYNGNPDVDGDGIGNSTDPFAWDASNYSSINGTTWGSHALGDYDEDGTPNWEDSSPGSNDNDGDGIENSADPSPNDSSNLSSHNGISWNGDVFGNADGDGTLNYWDAWPYDPTNGNPDSDGDGLPDSTDPASGDNTNHSSYNGIAWYSNALGDADNDGTANFYDPQPYEDGNANTDGDAYLDSNDPAPNDYYNHSSVNGVSWGNDALGNADGDETVNFFDPTPYGTPPVVDQDQDGLNSTEEAALGTSDTDPDSDDDGLTDAEEVNIFGSNPTNAHSLSQVLEPGSVRTDWQMVNLTDSDGDLIPDRIEKYYQLNPYWAGDAALDRDSNGTSNLEQYEAGIALDANVSVYDYDGDGMTDVFEDFYSPALSKIKKADAVEDADGDGVLNFEEAQLVLSPVSTDTFANAGPLGDLLVLMTSVRYPTSNPPTDDVSPANGIPDWAEAAKLNPSAPDHAYFTRQLAGDLDGDGMSDAWEHEYRRRTGTMQGLDLRIATDAAADSDHDGLINLTECRFGTNPLVPDSNSDQVGDASALYDSATMPQPVTGVTTPYQPEESTDFTGESRGRGPGSFNHLFGDGEPEPVPEFVFIEMATQVYVHTPGNPPVNTWTPPSFDQLDWNVTAERTVASISYGSEGFRKEGIYARARLAVPDPLNDRYFIFRSTYREGARVVHRSERPVRIDKGQTTTTSSLFIYAEPTPGQSLTVEYVRESPPPDQMPEGPPTSISAFENASSKYRKIALNGMPLSDSKPQVQDESGERDEETFIDAFSRRLQHAVTDVYAADPATLLPLMVRRDVNGDVWNKRSGLRPGEHPAQPFGPCWTSNICSYVRFHTDSSGNVKAAEVHDEQGASQRFVAYKNMSSGWQHSQEEMTNARTMGNTFTTTSNGAQAVLTKKFGTTCIYQMTNIQQRVAQDRLEGSPAFLTTFTYARLTEVRDRLGNSLVYEYPTPLPGAPPSLIPSCIRDPDRPGRQIFIMYDKGRVSKVKGPSGEVINYEYEDPANEDPSDALATVTRGGASVNYSYLRRGESEDSLQHPGSDFFVADTNHHTELASITDELGRTYRFSYEYDHSSAFIKAQIGNEPQDSKVQLGMPMCIKRVALPVLNGAASPTSHEVILSGNRSTKIQGGSGNAIEPLLEATTNVSGPCGGYAYTFSEPHIYRPTLTLGPDDSPRVLQVTVTYKKLSIRSPLGTESYSFNPRAMFAVAEARDISGHTTSFTYEVDSDPDPNATGFDDPVTETDALGHVKSFTYDTAPESNTRVMTSMTDRVGVTTSYAIQSGTGLKLGETVTDENGGILRQSFFEYNHTKFQGFMTKSTVDGSSTDTAPATVTTYALGSDPLDPLGWTAVTQTTATGSGDISTTTIQDPAGRKRSVVDGRGLVTNFDYDAAGRLETVTHPDGTTKEMAYDLHGNLVKETNENEVATFHEYDELNRRTKTTVDLNGDGGADESYEESDIVEGELVYDGDIVTTTTYNARNQVVTQTDARGTQTTNTYGAEGLLTETTKAGVTTGYYYDWNIGGSVFDTSRIKPCRTINPRGVTTTVVYDNLYRPVITTVMMPMVHTSPTTFIPAFSAATYTSFDNEGRPLTVTDPLGRVTANTYDALGQLVEVAEPDLTVDTTDNPTVQTFYTHHGKPWKVIDQNGSITTTEYDAAGRPVKVISPAVGGASAITTMEYDAAGNAIRMTDPLGRITETQYDERNRPVQVIAPPVWDSAAGGFVRPSTHTTYDDLGQVHTVTDPMGTVATTHYDNAGRKWKVEAPEPDTGAQRPTTFTHFDAGGLVLKVINPLGQEVTNTYDALGQLLSTVDAEGITNRFAYDAVGNRTSVKDGKNQETTFEYDWVNRLVRQTFADGVSWSYGYNEVQKTSQTSPRGIVTSYTYDARDRLLTVSAPAGHGAPALGRSYTYDDAGRLLTVTEAGNAAANVSYTYDAMGRVTRECSRGETHDYQYDLVGNRVEAVYGTGRQVETFYDALNRPEMIREGGRMTRYSYDLAGRAVILVGGNGQTSVNGYDSLGRLKQRTLFKTMAMTPADKLAQFSWEHDQVGNVLAQHETWPGETSRQPAGGIRSTVMTYDDNNRLLTEAIQTRADENAQPEEQSRTAYAYDAANNRISKTVIRTAADPATSQAAGENDAGRWDYVYNSANQLTEYTRLDEAGSQVGSGSMTYDEAGNRLQDFKLDVVNGEIDLLDRSYTWDAQDRLIRVGMTTFDNTSTHAYQYDYRTRRIGTQRVDETNAPSITRQTAIVFSGGLSLAEWESDTGSLPTSPTVEYTRGPDMGGGVGGLLYSLRNEDSGSGSTPSALGPTPRYNLSNGRGDIVAQSNQAAALTWTASYEAYGKRTKESGTNQDKQRGNSKDEDPTGLLNEGFRYRDLETGVWLSRDPAGFVDGPNLYAYVMQNPWTAFDPEGLALREVGRVERKDDTGWEEKNKPKRDALTKPKAQYEKEMASWNTARKNHEFNLNNTKKIEAWENYDKAVALLDTTPEGRAALTELRREDSGKVFEVVVGFEHRGVQLGDADGRVGYAMNEGGKEIYAVLLNPVATSALTTKFDSKTNSRVTNVDAGPLGNVWHEFNHAVEGGNPMNVDPLKLGTSSPMDRLSKGRAHERRATRFENIIRGRLGGQNVKTKYAQGTNREADVPDPVGTGDYFNSIQNKQ